MGPRNKQCSGPQPREWIGMLTPILVVEKETQNGERLVPPGMGLSFMLVTSLFFLWGVPNNLNDVLIRQFMKSFAISRFQAGLVQSAFYLGYFMFATPAALLMRKYGYKLGFLAGLCLLGAGTMLFWPAAIVARYSFFLFALFVIASGLSFLETAANPFIAQLGSGASGARRLNFCQAFNPLGAISGVLVGTIFIFSGVELNARQVAAMQAAHTYEAYLRHETLRVVDPYLVLGACAFLLAFLVWRTKFPVTEGEQDASTGDRGGYRDLLRHPHFILAILTQFMYIGAQVGTWSYFIQYVQDSIHQPEKVAGYFLTGTLAAFGVGRFSSAALMKYVKPGRLMGLYSAINIGLVATGILNRGWLGLWAIFATSFFMSVMYPTIFALGIDGLGRDTKIGGSLIVMAIVGGAILTPIMGLLAQSTHSIAEAYAIPLICYVFVAFYALIGCKIGRKNSAAQRAANV